MKHTYKQLAILAVLATTMGSSAFAANADNTIENALQNASWTNASSVNTDQLQGYVSPEAEAIAKVDGTPITANDTFIPAAVPAQYVTGLTAEKLKPFEGKTIAAINLDNIPVAYRPNIMNLLSSKVGAKVTEENILQDVGAIGNLGVFSEVNPNFKEVPEGVELSFTLVDNPVVKGVVVEGNTIYPQNDLLRYLNIPVGKVLNTVAVGQKTQGVDAAYNRDGYMLAKVENVTIDEQGILHIQINEGILEKVVVEGNTKTKSYVITREMLQKVGQPLNKFLARRSLQAVYNLGFFEDVNMRLLPGTTPDKVVMQIDVVEQKTGVITVGGGYSKSNGFSGLLEVGENNLRGTGDKVNVHWEFGGKSKGLNYALTYTRPWIDDKATSLSGSIFNRKVEVSDYDENAKPHATYKKKYNGMSVTLGRQTGLFSRVYLTAETRKDQYEGVLVYDPNKGEYVPHPSYGEYYGNNPTYLKNNFGRTNSITYQRVFDSRDNVYDPRHGKRFSYSLQWAGRGLGGDFDFAKASFEGRTYRDLGHDHVLAFRFGAGIIQGKAGYSQLFSVGGSDTLRGYEDDQFRGKKFYNGTVEYRLPIYKKVQGVLFVDIGDAWDTPNVPWYHGKRGIKVGYGPGLRIQTPIGPVRLDYGFGKNGSKFSFAFGGQF